MAPLLGLRRMDGGQLLIKLLQERTSRVASRTVRWPTPVQVLHCEITAFRLILSTV